MSKTKRAVAMGMKKIEDGPELVTLEYVGPYGRRKTPALVPGVGYVFYLDEKSFPKDVAERLQQTGEWALTANKCKYVLLTGERCPNDRAEGERFCPIHVRMYAPGETLEKKANGDE